MNCQEVFDEFINCDYLNDVYNTYFLPFSGRCSELLKSLCINFFSRQQLFIDGFNELLLIEFEVVGQEVFIVFCSQALSMLEKVGLSV